MDLSHQEQDLIRSLARMPDACRRLLVVHRADPRGECLGCRSQVRPTPPWPCAIHRLASAALANPR